MEYLEGKPLDVLLGERLDYGYQRGPALISAAAAGLGHAHSLDIVHRDVKPANIFVTNQNVVKILDFGLGQKAAMTRA